MYPIERYMKMLKKQVRNMARPEASMVEGYIQDECLVLSLNTCRGLELFNDAFGMLMKKKEMRVKC
jgi:hypothetical protein